MHLFLILSYHTIKIILSLPSYLAASSHASLYQWTYQCMYLRLYSVGSFLIKTNLLLHNSLIYAVLSEVSRF